MLTPLRIEGLAAGYQEEDHRVLAIPFGLI